MCQGLGAQIPTRSPLISSKYSSCAYLFASLPFPKPSLGEYEIRFCIHSALEVVMSSLLGYLGIVAWLNLQYNEYCPLFQEPI